MFGRFCILGMLLLLCEFRHEYKVVLHFIHPSIIVWLCLVSMLTFSPGQLPAMLQLPDGAGPVFSPQALLSSLSPITVEVAAIMQVRLREELS